MKDTVNSQQMTSLQSVPRRQAAWTGREKVDSGMGKLDSRSEVTGDGHLLSMVGRRFGNWS